MKPTKEQADIINSQAMSLAVDACPGSGKTATLILLAEKAAASGEKVSIITYTNAAANELKERLSARVITAEASTIHGFCRQSLSCRPQMIDSEFVSILALEAAASLAPKPTTLQLRNCRWSTTSKYRAVWQSVHTAMNQANVADHDWLIRRFIETPMTEATLLILDEKQDCSEATWTAFLGARNPDRALRKVAVGDPNQAIFGWTQESKVGAEIFNSQSERKTMTANFRSTSEIVNYCDRIMKEETRSIIGSSSEKVFISRHASEEGETSAMLLWARSVIKGGAIIVRTNKQREWIAQLLEATGINATEARPTRSRAYSKNVDWLRWAMMPKRSFLGLRHWGWRYGVNIPAHHAVWLSQGLLPALESACGEIDKKIRASLLALEADSASVGAWPDIIPTLLRSLQGEEDSQPPDKAIVVTTVHKAKGLEWDQVLLHGVDRRWSVLGGGTDKQEEKRIFYVACSRARNSLTISSANQPADSPNLIDELNK